VRRVTINRVLIGILALPVLFGALALWSMSDRAEQADHVPTAVVNLDKPVTTGKGKHKQVIYAGRLLAAGLTSPKTSRDDSLGWKLTDADDAQQGLRDGDYYAVITIPRGFSKTLAGIQGRNPRQAGITLQSNDASSAVIGQASRQVAAVAANRLGHTITTTYLEGVNKQTGKLKTQLSQAAHGAGKVADGTSEVGNGVRKLGGGADKLAGGAQKLSSGAARLHEGTGKLAGGATKLDGGAHRLADGLGRLSSATDPLPHQTRRLADGAGQVSKGVGPYTKIVKGWEQACLTNPAVAATNAQLCKGTIQAAGPNGRNADKLASGARQVAGGADQLADGTPKLKSGIDQSASGADKLASGTGRLATGTRKLDSATGKLAGGASRLGDGAGRLADGSGRLADGSGRLTSGSRKLASGLQQGADKIPTPSKDQPKVVADPVDTRASSINPERDGATLLVPLVLAFALYLGAFVTYLVRQALPDAWLSSAASGRRVALAGWLPAVAIGVGQAALLYVGVLVFGADITSPAGLAVLMVLCAAVFAAVNQAFVAVSGRRRGWIASIAFAMLQVVSIGGLVPIDTAPAPFQLANKVLPVSRAVDGFAHLTLGGQVGSLPADVTALVLWGVAAFLLTALAARRAQRLDPADLDSLDDDPAEAREAALR
jgi:putative membrane protein